MQRPSDQSKLPLCNTTAVVDVKVDDSSLKHLTISVVYFSSQALVQKMMEGITDECQGPNALGLVSVLPSVHLERWVLKFLEMSHSPAQLRRAHFGIRLRLPLTYWLTKGSVFLRTNELTHADVRRGAERKKQTLTGELLQPLITDTGKERGHGPQLPCQSPCRLIW